MKKSMEYGIEYDMMCRLNYSDLMYIIIEYDIAKIKKYLADKKKQYYAEKGIEVEQASNDKILSMHSRRKVVKKDGNS